MAEPSQMTAEEIKSLKTVFIGSNLIFWIISVFLIWILFGVNDQLKDLNQNVKMIQMGVKPGLDQYQVVDPADDEQVIYMFRRLDYPEDMMMEEEYGMPEEGMEAPEEETESGY